ncbi:nicotinamide mononucleotide transporter [Leuconostoc inhae]|uniref:nicotinamide mononucleotide transporter n=1 Tax=Leuconostoc inhae TaxID=178001 RepID=UPI001C7CFBD1|nr:nicotinamide mononucleotide transporter [Leuconostoc inhae]
MLKILKTLNESWIFDLLGVAIVIFTAYMSGYLFEDLTKTSYFSNIVWAKYVPFGMLSVISSSLSIMSTRLTARLNKFGNIIGTVNTLMSGAIDFTLGNSEAILTYPVSFLINAAAVKGWHEYGDKRVNRVTDFIKWLPLVIGGAILLSLGLNYLAFQNTSPLFWLASAVFSLSLIPNILNVFKIEDQWLFWIFYNLVQLAKAIAQGNFANIGKYLYYIVNSGVAYPIWRMARQK